MFDIMYSSENAGLNLGNLEMMCSYLIRWITLKGVYK